MNNETAGKNKEPKLVTIYINGTPKVVEKDHMSFDEIITLAFEAPPTGEGVDFTVQYTKGHSDKPKSTLVKGQSVKVKEGMEFDVTPTNRS